jgi:hypothetical protein
LQTEINMRRDIQTCRILHPPDPAWVLPGTYTLRTLDSPHKKRGCGHILRYMGPEARYWCRKHFEHKEACTQLSTMDGIRLAADTAYWNEAKGIRTRMQQIDISFPPLVQNPRVRGTTPTSDDRSGRQRQEWTWEKEGQPWPRGGGQLVVGQEGQY